jgi:Ran GTPase-activating protein (RanGAP) involved in mRNA processing and transport
MNELQQTFVKLKDDVYESVKTQPVDTFKVRLTSFDVNGQEHHLEFIEKIIDKKETIADIWIKLNSYLNFLNYEILAHILDKFPNQALRERMDDYTTQINTFFKNTKLCDFVKCWPVRGATPPVDTLQEFVVKSHKDWNTCTLEDLDHLKGSLARKLLLPKFAFFLEKASVGSVAVMFLVHSSLIAKLQADIKNTELKAFVDVDIETITVDGVVCFEAPLLQYTTHLKQLYTSRSPLQPLTDSKPKHLLPFRLARIEKQSLSQGDMNRFTRDSLRGDMDDVVYKKTAMELSELGVMADSSQPKVVLIEGAPGVGKTTFAWEQCRQWAEGKLLQAYSIVLLLPLRDNNIRQITSLPSLFRHSKGQVRDEVTRTVLGSHGKGCLIWLEAWDELVDNLRSDSLFTQLIRGIQLPAATIYITSRPWVTGGLLEQMGDRISQHTELLALAKEQVDIQKREISKQATDKLNRKDTPTTNSERSATPSALDFFQYIESHPVILAAMYTPVTAAIVDQVFKSAPHNPPTTVTQLYSAYVLMRLEHYLTEHPKYSDMNMKVRTLADLPERVSAHFQRLCALAYEGVSQQMIVFSSLPEGVSTLGLLQSVPQVYEEGEDQVSYNFLHYTVQEYLAALHLSHLQPQEQMTIIDTKWLRKIETKYGRTYYEATQFKTTFQFLAGITRLVGFPVDFLSNLLNQDAATMYSWLYESQNLPVLTSVLGSDKRKLSLSYSATTTDYFVAGYCLAHSNCTWRIGFDFYSVDDVSMEFLSKGCNHQLPETDISSKIVSASFMLGSITADGVEHFLTIPNSLLQHIQHLNLLGNKLDRRACDLLAEGVQRMPCLETLNLSGNPLIGCGGAVQLVSSLHSSELRQLDMSNTGISDADYECIASYIHSTTSLERLYIGGNDISVESIDSLCKALSANSSMRRLDMIGCHLTTSHCVCLGQLLRHPIHCKIEELDLRVCRMTSDGVGEVVDGLSDNHTLRVLNLSGNHIGSEGAVAVATMLKSNSSLERLYLDSCSIGSSGGVELGAALERNKTLRVLVLKSNAIGDDGVRGLCAGLENNSSLEELYLVGDESLGEEGVSLLLKCVEEKNRSLKRLILSEKYKRDIPSDLQSRCRVAWL